MSEGAVKRRRVQKAKITKGKILNTKYQIPNTVIHISTLNEVEKYLRKNIQGGEIVMVMGAGDIYNLTLSLTKSKIE